MKRAILVFLILAMAFIIVACGPLGTPSVDKIVAHLQESLQPHNVHLVVEMKASLPGMPEEEQTPMVVEQWVRDERHMRIEYKEGPKEIKGTVTVMDGENMWMYIPDQNMYMKVPLPETETMEPPPEILNAQLGKLVRQMLDTMTFSYLGTEEVAGRKAYKLEAKPKDGQKSGENTFTEGMDGPVTLWIDAERWTVLGMEMATDGGNISWRCRQIEYDVDFPDDLFTFVPPAGAKSAEEMGMPQIKTVTLEEAQAMVNFHILVPEKLPEGMELKVVQVMDTSQMGGHQEGEAPESMVTLMYQKGFATLSIVEMPLPEGVGEEVLPPLEEAEEVIVRGHKAVFTDMGMGGRSLMWQEDGLMITINSTLDKETLLEVAESLH